MQLFTLVVYFTIVAILQFIFLTHGQFILTRLFRTSEPLYFLISFIAFFFILSYIIGYFNIGILSVIIYLVLFSTPLILYYSKSIRLSLIQVKYDVLIASLISLLTFLSPLLYFERSNQFFGLASMGNNDLGDYSIILSQYAEHGNHGSSELANGTWQPLKDGYFGFTLVANFILKIFNVLSWQAIYIALIFSTSLLAFAVIRISRKFFSNLKRFQIYLVCAAGMLSPFQLYASSQGFGGQILGTVSLVAFIFTSYEIVRNREIYPINQVVFFMTFGISLITYFPFFCVQIAIQIGIFFYLLLIKCRISDIFKTFFISILPVFLFAEVSKNAWDSISIFTGIWAGWKLNLMDLIATQFGFQNINHARNLILFIGFLIAYAYLIFNYWLNCNRLNAYLISFYFTFVLTLGVLLRVRYQSWNDYHVWKGILYFAVITVIVFFALLITRFPTTSGAIIVFFVFTALFSFNEKWDIQLTNRQLHSNSSLMAIQKVLEENKIMSVNLKLAPYMETTLAAASIKGVQKFISVPTTGGFGDRPLTAIDTCTLVLQSELQEVNSEDAILIGDEYALINKPSDCKTRGGK